jgi:hypothetical protein
MTAQPKVVIGCSSDHPERLSDSGDRPIVVSMPVCFGVRRVTDIARIRKKHITSSSPRAGRSFRGVNGKLAPRGEGAQAFMHAEVL